MKEIEWGPSFELAIPEMNREHKELLKKMMLIRTLNDQSVSKEKLVAAMDALIQYTENHFAHEELVMRNLEYPDYGNHKRLHADMLEKLNTYKTELQHSVYSSIPSSVFDFFQNWLLTHILLIDKKYSDFAKGE